MERAEFARRVNELIAEADGSADPEVKDGITILYAIKAGLMINNLKPIVTAVRQHGYVRMGIHVVRS